MIRTAALDDILRQVERYAAQNLPAIARRFAAAALTAIETATENPAAGQPHAAMPGLHSRPIKGFTDFALYYRLDTAEPTILRVLHTKRDIEATPQTSKETP